MTSPDVAAVLDAGAPDAAGKLYDAHAEALFQYCWLTLRNRQQAKAAVCDALVQAAPRVPGLSDPARLRAWLFALVRAECHHHPLPSLGDTDEPIARPEQPDAALRIMAWNSVMSLDLVQRQALDLATRHGMTEAEIGSILGLPLPGTAQLLATARAQLERALAAEILVGRDRLECPGRTEVIHGWDGIVTTEFRDRLLEHATSCAVCQPRLLRDVSPGRVFGLLPAPVLDPEARTWVISRVGGPVPSQVAELDPGPDPAASPRPGREHEPPAGPAAPVQTVPAGLILLSPGTHADSAHYTAPVPESGLSALGLTPSGAGPGTSPRRDGQPPRRLGLPGFAAVSAAMAAAVIAAGLALGSTDRHGPLSAPDHQLANGSAAPPPALMRPPVPRPDTPSASPGGNGRSPGPVAATSSTADGADAMTSSEQATPSAHGVHRPAGRRHQVTHPTVTKTAVPTTQPAQAVVPTTQPTRPGPAGTAQAPARLIVSPASLSMGNGSSGQLTLTASGGSVSWTAASSSVNVVLSKKSGHLSNGGTDAVVVTVQGPGNGSGSATISINGTQITVYLGAMKSAFAAQSVSPSGGPDSPAAPSAPSAPAAPSALDGS